MLKDYSLQSPIAETPGGFQGLVVAGIGLLVAALLHEDLGRLHEAGDSVAVESQCTVNVNGLLCRAEGLVKASCCPQRIGEIAQRCGQVVPTVSVQASRRCLASCVLLVSRSSMVSDGDRLAACLTSCSQAPTASLRIGIARSA